jgi:hypothetical protein
MNSKLVGLLQLAFAGVYIAAGFLLLLLPALEEKMDSTKRIALAVILMLYAGYRCFYVYRKYFSAKNNEGQ